MHVNSAVLKNIVGLFCLGHCVKHGIKCDIVTDLAVVH